MESEAKYTLIGAIVLALGVAIAVAIVWITKASPTDVYERYTIYFAKQTLDGLQINSSVTMKGIKVGNVLSLEIAPQNIEEVRVTIQVQQGTPVKVDTGAVINRNLLTGLAGIDLVGSTQGSPPLMNHPAGEEYPVIAEGRSQIDAFASSVPAVLNNIARVAERIEGFLSPENEKAFTQSFANIERLTDALSGPDADLKGLVADLRVLTKDLQRASRSFSDFSEKGNNELARFGDELNEGAEKMNQILNKIDNAAGDLSFAVTGTARLALQQLEAVAQSLATASKKVSATADEFQDPNRILYGPKATGLGPGEGRQ